MNRGRGGMRSLVLVKGTELFEKRREIIMYQDGYMSTAMDINICTK